MTREQFEKTAYNGRITYETYLMCDCTECKRDCIHRETYRRMPKEVGGIGECPNLKAKYKLQVYKAIGVYDHEEYFYTKEEMDDRYELFMSYRIDEPLHTAWELVDGEWKRLVGY